MSEEASGSAGPPAPRAGGVSAGASVQGFTPLPTNARIGELVVQSLLGAGEFAITYATEHARRSKRYALKEYFPRAICYRDGGVVRPQPQHAAVYAWGLERFLSEARALQQVRHPALVEVLGVTQHGGTGYAGMAYEGGRDLGIWLHEQKRIAPQEEIDRLLAPILDGLAKAHAARVYHFDLGPDCIIVRDNGTPVIVDFGVFRVGLRRRLPPGRLETQIYAAPELLAAAGGPVGPWTDVYSLAGLLYLAVTGKPPLPAVVRAAGTDMPTAVAAAQGRYRRQFLEAIDAGLKLPPAQRPRSLPDWSRALIGASGSRLALSLFTLTGLSRAQRASAPEPSPSPLPAAARGAPAAEPATAAHRAQSPAAVEEVSDTSLFERSEAPAAAERQPRARDRARSPSFRAVGLGAVGLLAGSGAGALVGALAGSLLRSECPVEGCIAPLLLPFAAVGALIGLWEGIRHAGKPARDYDL